MRMLYRKCLFAVLLLGAVSLSAVAAVAEESPSVFDARKLWQSFHDTQSSAEHALIGKTIQIRGVVIETGMSIYLTPNVRLSDTAGGQIYVTCVLPRGDTGLLSTFAVGEEVTMSGRVYRFSSSGSVVVKESQRVKE